jgi:hypothetical protein
VLLVVSGALKLRDPGGARAVFEALGLGRLAGPAVAGLIVLELALGAQVLSGWQATTTLVSTTAVFLAFTVVLVVLRREDYDGGCSCFGGYGGATVGRLQIARNVVLSSAAGLAAIVSLRGTCVGLSPTEVPVAAYASAGVLLLAGSTAYVLISRASSLLVGPEAFSDHSWSDR